MLLTNQKTINYEIYINNKKETTPSFFASAKVVNKSSFFDEKYTLTQHMQKYLRNVLYFFTFHKKSIILSIYSQSSHIQLFFICSLKNNCLSKMIVV
jgi:hypothetical protein